MYIIVYRKMLFEIRGQQNKFGKYYKYGIGNIGK